MLDDDQIQNFLGDLIAAQFLQRNVLKQQFLRDLSQSIIEMFFDVNNNQPKHAETKCKQLESLIDIIIINLEDNMRETLHMDEFSQ